MGGGGAGNAFWNFRRQGGVKTWKPSIVGYGYFLELPNLNFLFIMSGTGSDNINIFVIQVHLQIFQAVIRCSDHFVHLVVLFTFVVIG